MTLWGGRFSTKLNGQAWNLNTSLSFDQRLALPDVSGSIAWAQALLGAGVLTSDDHAVITDELKVIAGELSSGAFRFVETDEDIHTAIERRLGELAGPAAGKLHTGRSRNDQVATDFRLWMLQALPSLDQAVEGLQTALLEIAERNQAVLMPGYTHLQRAQPITLAHWFMSHIWPLQRDRSRLADLRARVAVCPLGCGALAGTAFEIDRDTLSQALGFDVPAPNSLDAVSDRDFAAEYLFCTAMIGLHLSRLSEAVVLFTSAEFGFFELSDAYSTGSSLMPQKKNPDLFELARGKAGTLIGLLTGLMVTLKGLPSTYDKDLQEDKVPVFQATDILLAVLPVLAGALQTMTVMPEKMRAAIDPTMMATDLADELVRQGIPFREAHAAVGRALQMAAMKGASLNQLSTGDWESAGIKDINMNRVFDPMASVSRRAAVGGTAPAAVTQQIQEAKSVIKGDRL